jgi:pimeloyl-ACP methyl ester carboxylesterase
MGFRRAGRRLSFYDLDIPENSGYFISRMAGLQVGYPELSLRDILTEAGLELLTAQSWGCYEIFGAGAALAEPYAKPEALEPGTQWRQRLEENDEFLPISDDIPVFMIQGDEDIDVPVELTREVNADLCAQGSKLEYLELAGVDHMEAFAPSAALVPNWFDDRFRGQPAVNHCER